MKAVAAHLADCAEPLAFVFCEDTLCRILDDQQVMTPCDRHNLVHFAADAGIMDREDCARARRDRGFDQPLVDVKRVRPDIHEHRRGAPQHNSVCGGDEGKGWKNHLVAWTEVA